MSVWNSSSGRVSTHMELSHLNNVSLLSSLRLRLGPSSCPFAWVGMMLILTSVLVMWHHLNDSGKTQSVTSTCILALFLRNRVLDNVPKYKLDFLLSVMAKYAHVTEFWPM